MDVTPLISHNAQVIQSYAGGIFKVSGESYNGAVLITATETVLWDVQSFDVLSVSDFEILSKDVDVVLLGTGKTMSIIPPKLRAEIKGIGLSVDSMDTGAACRTYNVLMAEGRRVACTLFPYV